MINRFYQPSRSQYISQFAPDEIPADLMLKVLGTKQAKSDQINKELQDAKAKFKVDAIEGFDTKFRDQHKTEFHEFITQSASMDLTSPEYLRNYQAKLSKFNPEDNKELKTIQSQYDYDQSVQKLKEDIQKKGPISYADELYFKDYDYRKQAYIKGQGFKGNITLGDKDRITEGIDKLKAADEIFQPIKASGKEDTLAYENSFGKSYYEISNEGVSSNRITKTVNQMLDATMESPLGKQLREEFYIKNKIYSLDREKLSEEDTKKLENAVKSYTWDYLRDAGSRFIYNKHTTTKKDSLNALEQIGRKQKEENEYDILTSTLGGSTTTVNDLESTIKNTKLEQQSAYKEYQKALSAKPGTYTQETLNRMKQISLDKWHEVNYLELQKNKEWNNLYISSGTKTIDESLKQKKNELWNNLTSSQQELYKDMIKRNSTEDIFQFVDRTLDSWAGKEPRNENEKVVKNYFYNLKKVLDKEKNNKKYMQEQWEAIADKPIENQKVAIEQNVFTLEPDLGKSISTNILNNANTGGFNFYNAKKGTPYTMENKQIINIEPNVQLTTDDYHAISGDKKRRAYGVTATVRSYKWDSKSKKNIPVDTKINLAAVPNSNIIDIDYSTIANNFLKQAFITSDSNKKDFLIDQAFSLKNHILSNAIDNFNIESPDIDREYTKDITSDEGLASNNSMVRLNKKGDRIIVSHFDRNNNKFSPSTTPDQTFQNMEEVENYLTRLNTLFKN